MYVCTYLYVAVDQYMTHQHLLSSKLELEAAKLHHLLNNSSAADKARLLSVSSANASSWLLATPSPSLGLHLDPEEIQVAIK